MATAATLTVKQAIAGFGVSDMTLYAWRKGIPSRDPLPHVVEGRKVIMKLSEVKAWAKKYGLTFNESATAVSTEPVKTGPKATALAKAKAAAVVEKAKRATPPAKKAAKKAKAAA